jgi:hypothetical protein
MAEFFPARWKLFKRLLVAGLHDQHQVGMVAHPAAGDLLGA